MGVYYSIQTVRAWKQFQKQNFMEGNSNKAMYPKEYLWMMEQMAKRLPEYLGEHPIWLWTEKPQLKQSGHLPKRKAGVCLTIEIPDEKVLLSEFNAWHSVLNDDFCSLNEQEDDDYHEGLLVMTKEESWERIFSPVNFQDQEWWGTNQVFQGVTGRIPIEWVKKVKYFRGRE